MPLSVSSKVWIKNLCNQMDVDEAACSAAVLKRREMGIVSLNYNNNNQLRSFTKLKVRDRSHAVPRGSERLTAKVTALNG